MMVSEERKGTRILPIICRCYQCRQVDRTLNFYGVNLCLNCCVKAIEHLKAQAEGKLSTYRQRTGARGKQGSSFLMGRK